MNFAKCLMMNAFIFMNSVKTAGVTFILQFRLPSHIEHMELGSNHEIFYWKPKNISYVDNDDQFFENQFYDQFQIHFDQYRRIYVIPLDIEMTTCFSLASKFNEKKSYLILECDNNRMLPIKESVPTYGQTPNTDDKFFITLDRLIGDNIEWKNNLDDIRVFNIKHMLSKFKKEDYEFLCEKQYFFDSIIFKSQTNFVLNYFKDHLECFNSLKNFLNSLKHLRVVQSRVQGEIFNTITESELAEFFLEKFNKEYKKLDNEDSNDSLKRLFQSICIKQTYYQLKDVLLLPIASIDELKNRLEKIYEINSRIFKHMLSTPWLKDKFENHHYIIRFIRSSLQMYSANELLKFIQNNYNEYTFNVNFDQQKILFDPENFERMVCDFFNAMTTIWNIRKNIVMPLGPDLKYVKPIANNNFKCVISKAIQISIEEKVNSIKAYNNNQEKEINLIENHDYFRSDYCTFQTYVFPFENMRKHCVEEIVIIFASQRSQKYQIGDFLHDQETNQRLGKRSFQDPFGSDVVPRMQTKTEMFKLKH